MPVPRYLQRRLRFLPLRSAPTRCRETSGSTLGRMTFSQPSTISKLLGAGLNNTTSGIMTSTSSWLGASDRVMVNTCSWSGVVNWIAPCCYHVYLINFYEKSKPGDVPVKHHIHIGRSHASLGTSDGTCREMKDGSVKPTDPIVEGMIFYINVNFPFFETNILTRFKFQTFFYDKLEF